MLQVYPTFQRISTLHDFCCVFVLSLLLVPNPLVNLDLFKAYSCRDSQDLLAIGVAMSLVVELHQLTVLRLGLSYTLVISAFHRIYRRAHQNQNESLISI